MPAKEFRNTFQKIIEKMQIEAPTNVTFARLVIVTFNVAFCIMTPSNTVNARDTNNKEYYVD